MREQAQVDGSLLRALAALDFGDRVMRIEFVPGGRVADAAERAAASILAFARVLWGDQAREVMCLDVERLGLADRAGSGDGRVWRLVGAASSAGCATVEPRAVPEFSVLGRAAGDRDVLIVTADGGRAELRGQPA